MTVLITDTTALRELAQPLPAAADDCTCRLVNFTAWDSITEDRWPASQMQPLATLRDPEGPEPSFEEYHPQGTRYDSPDAPLALHWFPTNRASVWRCRNCGLTVLRYTEFGGYYVDHRVRVLDPARIVDAPPPVA